MFKNLLFLLIPFIISGQHFKPIYIDTLYYRSNIMDQDWVGIPANDIATGETIRDSIPIVNDTTELKTLDLSNGRFAYLKGLNSNAIGSGYFVVIDSEIIESYGGVVYNHPTNGKQWVRQNYIETKTVLSEWFDNIKDAVDFSSSEGCKLIINKALTLSRDLDIGKNVDLNIQKGAIITTGSNTLTIEGNITAGNYQIFSGSNIKITKSPLNPLWFGAYNDGTHADETTMAFQTMFNTPIVNSSGYKVADSLQYGKVVIPTGTYLINDTITINHPWEIKGEGRAVNYNYIVGSGYLPIPNTTLIAIDSIFIFHFKTSTNDSYQLYGSKVENIVFEDESREISGFPTNIAKGAILINNKQHMFIVNCVFNFFHHGYGIKSYNAGYSMGSIWADIGWNVFRNCQYGVESSGTAANSWNIHSNRFISLGTGYNNGFYSYNNDECFGVYITGSGTRIVDNVIDIQQRSSINYSVPGRWINVSGNTYYMLNPADDVTDVKFNGVSGTKKSSSSGVTDYMDWCYSYGATNKLDTLFVNTPDTTEITYTASTWPKGSFVFKLNAQGADIHGNYWDTNIVNGIYLFGNGSDVATIYENRIGADTALVIANGVDGTITGYAGFSANYDIVDNNQTINGTQIQSVHNSSGISIYDYNHTNEYFGTNFSLSNYYNRFGKSVLVNNEIGILDNDASGSSALRLYEDNLSTDYYNIKLLSNTSTLYDTVQFGDRHSTYYGYKKMHFRGYSYKWIAGVTTSGEGFYGENGIESSFGFNYRGVLSLFYGANSLTTAGGTKDNYFIVNRSSNPPTGSDAASNKAYLFVSPSGEWTVIDTSGNSTTISPHNSGILPGNEIGIDKNEWYYNSITKDSIQISVNMFKVIQKLEEITDEQFIWKKDLKRGRYIK